MAALLGIVNNKTGVVYFQHDSVLQCRIFLNNAGLDCTYEGWQSDKYLGAIYFNGKGRGWTAAYWVRVLSKEAAA